MTITQRLLGRIASAIAIQPAVRLDRGPICCFTFDDCPKSALYNGGAALEAAGVGGTFFVSAHAAISNSSASHPLMWGEDLVRASAAGHEIGCHTYSHPHMSELGTAQLKHELDANLDAVRSVLPDVHFASFAYPFGEVSIRAKRLVASTFAVARGVRPGLNGRVVDLSELRAQGLRSRHFDRAQLSRIVRHAAGSRAWLVFATHDVVDEPSPWGCTPAEFEFALRTVRNAGIEILTLKAALGRVSHRNASE